MIWYLNNTDTLTTKYQHIFSVQILLLGHVFSSSCQIKEQEPWLNNVYQTCMTGSFSKKGDAIDAFVVISAIDYQSNVYMIYLNIVIWFQFDIFYVHFISLELNKTFFKMLRAVILYDMTIQVYETAQVKHFLLSFIRKLTISGFLLAPINLRTFPHFYNINYNNFPYISM